MFVKKKKKIICLPGKVWIFHSGKKDQAVLWPLPASADVSLDVCRNTGGPWKAKAKAGAWRQIKKGPRERREH